MRKAITLKVENLLLSQKEGEKCMYSYGLAFGALCGLLAGIYLDQMTWGIIIGAGVGLIIGLIIDNRKEKEKQ